MKALASRTRQFLPELVFIFCLISIDFLVKNITTRTYVNARSAFSLPFPSAMSLIISVFIIIITLVWLYITPRESIFQRASFMLIIAGGSANTIERAYRGFVTDIFHLPSASFNLADLYIVIGIILLLITAFVSTPTSKQIHHAHLSPDVKK